MANNYRKQYLFASDFDQTLTFNDTGYVLSEMLGISIEEFERKAKGMAKLNLVQQGAELAYLLLHDPEFRSRVRRDDLLEVGKRIRLKDNIKQIYEILDHRIDGFHFDFYVLSAAPVEVIQSALDGIVPQDHIYGTEFKYRASGEIESLVRATAGYGKVTRLDQLEEELGIPADHVVYVGDGSSDIHVMLQVNRRDGFTIAVSETKLVAQIAKRTVLSDNALATLVPILEDIAGWQRMQIRQLFDAYGFLIQGWDRVQTDWVTLSGNGCRLSLEPITQLLRFSQQLIWRSRVPSGCGAAIRSRTVKRPCYDAAVISRRFMKLSRAVLLLLLLVAISAVVLVEAQSLERIPQGLEALRLSSSSKTEFTLDHSMLMLASKLDPDNEDLRHVIAGVNGVSVHSYRYSRPWIYDAEALTSVKEEYGAAGWKHVLNNHEREGGTDVWLRWENNAISNVAILVAKSNEVDFIAVSGSVSPMDLSHLGGHFGIPKIEGGVTVPNTAAK